LPAPDRRGREKLEPDKHVEAPGKGFRTRVRFPPPPPIFAAAPRKLSRRSALSDFIPACESGLSLPFFAGRTIANDHRSIKLPSGGSGLDLSSTSDEGEESNDARITVTSSCGAHREGNTYSSGPKRNSRPRSGESLYGREPSARSSRQEKPRAVPIRLYVPAHDERMERFEITDCDLKGSGRPTIPALCLHRAGRCDAIQHSA